VPDTQGSAETETEKVTEVVGRFSDRTSFQAAVEALRGAGFEGPTRLGHLPLDLGRAPIRWYPTSRTGARLATGAWALAHLADLTGSGLWRGLAGLLRIPTRVPLRWPALRATRRRFVELERYSCR